MTGDGDQWSTYQPSGSGSEPDPTPPRTPEPLPPTHVPYGTPDALVTYQGHVPRSGGSAAAVVAIVVLLIAGITGAVIYFAASETVQDAFSATSDEPPDVLSADGYADLLTAIRDRTGGTEVFSAVLYPEYASIDVPEDATSPRQRTLFYNGNLDDSESLGRADNERIDLADIEAATFVRLLTKVRALVEDPTTSYVIIEGPSTTFDDDGTRLRVYASNDYSETAYISADAKGKVLRTYSSVEDEQNEG